MESNTFVRMGVVGILRYEEEFNRRLIEPLAILVSEALRNDPSERIWSYSYRYIWKTALAIHSYRGKAGK